MLFLRKALVWLAVGILPIILFALAATFVLQHTIGKPDTIKQTLRESGIYASAVDIFLKETDNPNRDDQGKISTENPVVQEAFKKAFSPEFLQTSTENFIDGAYSWLEGKTSKNEFKIDLTAPKATLIEEIAKGAEARASTLPACPRGQNSFEEPFSATCLPRGMRASTAGDIIRQEFAETEFLKDPVITADDLKTSQKPESQATAEQTPVNESSNKLPEIYQGLKKAPTILATLTVLLILAIVFLSENIQKGLKRAGISVLVVGLTLLVLSWVATRVINNQLVTKIKLDNTVLQDKLQKSVKDLSSQFGSNFMTFGGVYAALGAVAIGGSIFLGRRNPQPAPVSTSAKSAAQKPTKAKK